ncbi:hypothetical protein [uncultured Microbulbifer sp.]|uniref:hypothetical protein n=1 Tax=uncultured Microbulbifer sp. TaxID=348147 RepID=UPI0026364DE9|nr:hypothetical protein [uncultured Microbulbifer sp.]
MRNFLKYSGLQLRKVETPVTPVGPDFESAKRKKIIIDGAQVSLILPRHDSGRRKKEKLEPKGDHVRVGYSSRNISNFIKNEAWESWPILKRVWAFYGSWFVGQLANINFSISAYRWKFQPENTSVFHPKIFELAVTHFLNSSYGYETDEGVPWHQAPVNWQVIDSLPVPAAKFRVESKLGYSPSRMQIMQFPVSDKVIVKIQASFGQTCPAHIGILGEEIRDEEMQALLDKVYCSVQLDFGDIDKSGLRNSLQVAGDATLTKSFAPLKWPVYVDKYGKESEEIKKMIVSGQ